MWGLSVKKKRERRTFGEGSEKSVGREKGELLAAGKTERKREKTWGRKNRVFLSEISYESERFELGRLIS